jgi:hypothetical protein
MFIIVAATPTDAPASQASIRADESGVSSVLPMLDGHFDPERQSYENQAQLYFVRLLDSTQIAIDVGRERMGTDKRAGTLDFGGSASQRTISARTGAPHETGEAVARLSFTPATDAMVCAAPLARAAATAGIAARELPPGTECVYTAVARIGDGPVVRWQWRTDVLPRLQPATPDMVHLDAASTEGKLLLEWGFEARVLGYVPNVRGVATGLV